VVANLRSLVFLLRELLSAAPARLRWISGGAVAAVSPLNLDPLQSRDIRTSRFVRGF
jgi:hypothetical protein